MKMMSYITSIASKITLISAVSMLLVVEAVQEPPGFISIDCGGSTGYRDSATNLTWEKDEPYVLTGMNGEVPIPPNKSDNYQALLTFRYFPHRRNKYCYELPVKPANISILIRAMFLHGNSSKLVLPIKFDIYVNATLWGSVLYTVDDYIYEVDYTLPAKVLEGIIYSPGPITYVCIVPDQGIPFISSLELRPLDPEGVMYSSIDNKLLLLSKLLRWNVGASSWQTWRYPDDAYDRIWTAAFLPGTNKKARERHASTSSVWNNVPPVVMMTAATFTEDDGKKQLLSPSDVGHTKISSGFLYAVFYSEALDNSSGLYTMSIRLNDEQSTPFNVSDIPVLQVFKHSLATSSDQISINVIATSTSESILNALEVYEEIVVHPAVNTDENVGAFLKTALNLTDWQGDLCFPVPDDWVDCQLDDESGLYISSLILTNVHNTAMLQNYTLGWSEQQLRDYTPLTDLSITYSDIDDATFQYLIDHFTTLYLNSVNISHNRISKFRKTKWWTDHTLSPDPHSRSTPDSIDMSHNLLTGEFPTFSETRGWLSYLNLSYNSITSFSSFWGNDTIGTGLSGLITLDVSHNSISSDISSSSITQMLKRNNVWLETLDMSDNFLTGTLPVDFYFSKKALPSLSLLNLDRNNISGILNLSTWFQRLQEASKKLDQSLADGLYSLKNNNIIDVTPNVDAFEPTIKFLMMNFSNFNQSGVLLSGNPFCKHARSFMQQYVCRSSVNTIIKKYEKKKIFTIPIVLGIGFVTFCFFILSLIIWRLWRRLSSASKLLQEVQQELINRKVQPPFFSYHSLRIATKNFHPDHELGSGGFGVVYKGILPDGTSIAVKRLFSSEKEAVLNDFLNEVVLITGIKHKNLIQLKGCCITDKERILVYEFATRGNLAQALWDHNESQQLVWKERTNIAVGIARGLSYLHEELQPRIIHRDIKAVNVLLDENLAPKIADFGLARLFQDDETQAQFTAVAGTRGYFAPEYVIEGQLTTKADVYSFGILLLEISTGKKCIDVTQSADHVYLKNWAESLKKEGSLSELLPPYVRAGCPDGQFTQMMDIALLCTRVNPKLRPHMSQVVTMLSEVIGVSIDWTTDGSLEKDFEFNPSASPPGSLLSALSLGSIDSEEIPFVSSFVSSSSSYPSNL